MKALSKTFGWLILLLIPSGTRSFVLRKAITAQSKLAPQRTSRTVFSELHCSLDVMWDVFKPLYYQLEKSVAGKQIPRVADIANRRTLKDQPLQPSDPSFDHSLWDGVLKRHVTPDCTFGSVTGVNGVDYDGVAADSDFGSYLEALKENDPAKLPAAEQLAFWINAYNALCISLIVEHERKGEKLKSINDLTTDQAGTVWDQTAGSVGGTAVSLNDIEHNQLRKVWDEPSLHGCIVCASSSCPNLRPEAFVGKRIKEQMEDQMKLWMANPTKGYRRSGERLELSRIFLWFQDDFRGKDGVYKFLPPYLDGGSSSNNDLSKTVKKLRYFEYDWQINRA